MAKDLKIEEQIGSFDYRSKPHIFMKFALEMATLPFMLDIVEQIVSPLFCFTKLPIS